MTIKSIVELLAQADATLEDNTTGAISAADVRNMIKDILDTVSPAYGAINLLTQQLTLSAVPQAIAPFATTVVATTGYYTTNLTAGQVTRAIQSASIAGATDFIIIDGNIEGPNNDEATIQLYKNGVAMPFTQSVTLRGASRPVGFNLAAFSYTAVPGDAVYEVRVSGDPGVKTLTNTLMLCQAQPVRSFT
jgi:hypothetical protein